METSMLHPRVLYSEQAMMEIYHLEGELDSSQVSWCGPGDKVVGQLTFTFWVCKAVGWEWVCRWAQGSRVDGEGPSLLGLGHLFGVWVCLPCFWMGASRSRDVDSGLDTCLPLELHSLFLGPTSAWMGSSLLPGWPIWRMKWVPDPGWVTASKLFQACTQHCLSFHLQELGP